MTQRPKFIWEEKYAPKTLADCVFPPRIRDLLEGYVKGGEFPNLLLAGKPGTGKTTIARVLTRELNLTDCFIDGSKDSGIDVLRTRMEDFVSTQGLDGRGKVLIVDEADYLNPQSTQPALRGFITKYQNSCRFIFTCNYRNKILDAIASRCLEVDFSYSESEKRSVQEQMIVRLKSILKAEGVEFIPKALAQVVVKYYPDNRRMLNQLQNYAIANGRIDAGIMVAKEGGSIEALVAILKAKKYGELREWIYSGIESDTTRVYSEMVDVCFEYLKPESIPEAIKALGEYQFKAAFVADHKLNLLTCLGEIMFGVEFK